ncbi:MAG TPA: hypothetical protein VGL89_17375 [Candidatus Koribacter sp.]|jgi:hypothetical protein
MTCAWYEQQLQANADLWHNGRPTPSLLDHARTCAACDAFIACELELKLSLAQLAESSRNTESSAFLKRNLLAELDAQHAQPGPRANWIPRIAFAVAALILVAIGTIFFHRAPQPHPPTITTTRTPTQSAPAVTPVEQAAPTQVAAVRPPKVHPTHHRETGPSTNADFYPVVMCDSLACSGPTMTVRVELPASPLATENDNRKITADLIVGDDGLIRAVRFVQ